MSTGGTVGGVAGGVVGSYFGPAGAAIGSGLGGAIGNAFDSPDPYQSPNFADINLATENPELYAELLKLSAVADQAEQAYNQRIQGMSALQNSEIAANHDQIQRTQAPRGLLGTSAGMSAETNANAMMESQFDAQNRAQAIALQQQALAARQAVLQATASAQQQVINPQLDQSKINYNASMDNSQAGNQFYSGLFNAGLTMSANDANTKNLQSQYPVGVAPSPYAANPYSNANNPFSSPTYDPSSFNPVTGYGPTLGYR